jgi:O-acetyl-ADP-ribose deacetylase (regulator of RNase III)
VGPVWHEGTSGEDDLLASCYQKSFKLAREYNLQSIAFPAISTGVYGFPKQRAASIAVRETKKEMADNNELLKVFFVCFNDETRTAYEEALQEKR